MVEHIASGAVNHAIGFKNFSGDYMATIFYNERFFAVIRGNCFDADARDHRECEVRGTDEADGFRMNHWPFIIAAYAVTGVIFLSVLIISFVAMRRAETAVRGMRGEP